MVDWMKMMDCLSNIMNKVESNYINKWKKTPQSFTRNRKLPPLTLCLQLFANKGRSLKNELFDFYNQYNLNGNVSSWGFSKRRLEFDPLMIHEMNHDLLKSYYSDNIKTLSSYKGYFIMGIDGSDIRIPTTAENYEYFGFQKRKGHDSNNEPCMASISCLYDCMNNFILDTTINKFKYAERDSAIEHLNNTVDVCPKNSIYVFDRGYFSFKMIYLLKDKKYIFKLRADSLIQEQNKLTTNDQVVEIDYSGRRRHLYGINSEITSFFTEEKCNIRILTLENNNGKNEFLITNIFEEELKIEDIINIYKLRWEIETSYRNLKSQMKLEEFSGYLKDIIKQDIYISNILYNLISAIIIENANINQEKYMYQMHVNRNYSTGIIKTLFIKILLSSGKEKEKLEEILYDEINKNVVPIRKKSNPRKRNIKNKCSMSYKNSY